MYIRNYEGNIIFGTIEMLRKPSHYYREYNPGNNIGKALNGDMMY